MEDEIWAHQDTPKSKVAIDSMAPHNIPNEEEIQECAISRKIRGYSLLG
jgi:hypothetical protein